MPVSGATVVEEVRRGSLRVFHAKEMLGKEWDQWKGEIGMIVEVHKRRLGGRKKLKQVTKVYNTVAGRKRGTEGYHLVKQGGVYQYELWIYNPGDYDGCIVMTVEDAREVLEYDDVD